MARDGAPGRPAGDDPEPAAGGGPMSEGARHGGHAFGQSGESAPGARIAGQAAVVGDLDPVGPHPDRAQFGVGVPQHIGHRLPHDVAEHLAQFGAHGIGRGGQIGPYPGGPQGQAGTREASLSSDRVR